MADATAIEDLKEEIRRNIGAVRNYCPFECSMGMLDEYGYCEHLIGFTNGDGPGAVLEPIVQNPITELAMVNGRHARKSTVIPPSNEVVQKGDKLINPEEVQLVNGVQNICKKWVSSRVYREKKTELKKSA